MPGRLTALEGLTCLCCPETWGERGHGKSEKGANAANVSEPGKGLEPGRGPQPWAVHCALIGVLTAARRPSALSTSILKMRKLRPQGSAESPAAGTEPGLELRPRLFCLY